MKKLLFTAVSILSVCAMAADSGFVSGTTFTNKTSGVAFDIENADNDGYWVNRMLDHDGQPTVHVEVEGVYTNRDDLATYSGYRPTQWAGEDGSNPVALQITDASVPLYRNIRDTSGQEVDLTNEDQYWNLTSDGAITFDSLVLFTAADGAPSPDDEDKLVVWLLGEEEGDNPQTNLMITAGFNTSGSTVVSTNYVVSLKDVTVNAGEWYRLTISAEKDTVGGAPTAKFTVYVNGEQAKGIPEDGGEEVDTFPSRVADKLGSQVLGGVGFKGTGAVDDLTFTTVNPFVAPEQKYFSAGEDQYDTFADAAGDGATSITLLADYDAVNEKLDAITVDDGNEYTLNIGANSITNSGSGNVGVEVDDGTLTVVGTGAISGDPEEYAVYVGADGTVVFGTSADNVPTINGSIYVEEGATVKYFASTKPSIVLDGDGSPAWSDATDEDGYYTVVFGGGGDEPVLDPASGTVEVVVPAASAADKDAAEAVAKAAITVPSGATVDKAVYAEYFKYSVTGEGPYTVTITGVKDTIKAEVLESAVERLTDDEATTIDVPAGLYYSITPSTALPIDGTALKGLSTGGTVTVDKPGKDKGFYEVKISATEIK